MNTGKHLLTTLLLLIFSSCGGIKTKASKEGIKLYETFFVGEEGTQYFIKPLKFKNSTESILVDTTFRYKKKIEDSKPVDIKISLLSIDFIKEIKSITIKNTSGSSITINNNDIELLFNDQSKKGYISRFSAKCSLVDLKKLHEDNSWNITIDQRPTFISTSSTEKKLEKLSRAIFILL